MTDQSTRLEAATIKAEIGSGIVYKFSNDAASDPDIPTLSGDIPNLKKVILRIQNEGAEKISFATKIFITTAAGIAGTSNQEIFLVQSADPDEIYEVWQNVSGTAVDTGKRSLSAAAVIEATRAASEAAISAQASADDATVKVARFLSPSDVEPTQRDNGQSLQVGDQWPNTSNGLVYNWSGTSWVALNSSVQTLEAELLSRSGSSLVGVASGGNLAQAVTYVTPPMFGAVNNGVADDFQAITMAATYAAANKVELWLGGSYAISAGVDFSGVRKIRCFNDARIVPLMDAGVAVRWVAPSGALIEKPVQEGDLFVDWPTRDWTKDRTSFLTQNIYNGTFNLSSAKATRGLLMKGLERGVVYNNVNIGVFSNNLVGVWLSSGSAAGWCNANLIHGGRYYGASGTGVGQTVAGSLYESQAGHLYVETTPYANNGNKFVNPSLEWIGPGFKLARMGGISNTLAPSYCELRDGDVTWITDVGTNNNFELMGVPSISGGYDSDLSPSANRVDVSSATDPKVSGSGGYINGNVVQEVRTRSGVRAAIRGVNTAAGPAIEARNTSSASNPSLVIAGPDGTTGVSIPAAGTWKVFGGTKSMSWSSGVAPTSGAWARGDLVFFTSPSAGGFIGAVCVVAGAPGTWKNFGAISA